MANPNHVYVPENLIWNIDEIKSMDPASQEFRELIVQLYQNNNVHAMAINRNDGGTGGNGGGGVAGVREIGDIAYTLTLDDANYFIVMTSLGAISRNVQVIVPNDDDVPFPIGTQIWTAPATIETHVYGPFYLTPSPGVTFVLSNNSPTTKFWIVTIAIGYTIAFIKTGINRWHIVNRGSTWTEVPPQ